MVANHLISTDIDAAGLDLSAPSAIARGPVDGGPQGHVVPFECVVRGYLSGSGWKEYRTAGTVCGIKLPAGPGRERPDRADLHPGHQGRERATTRTSRSRRWPTRRRGSRPRRYDAEPGRLSPAPRIMP